MAIKNIILDIGNVLAHFCWEKVLSEMLNLSGEDFDRVAAATTKSELWNELDRGIMGDEVVMKRCIQLSPGDEENITKFFSHLGDIVDEYEYSYKWIESLKKGGYKVYLLSNFGETAFKKCRKNGKLSFVDIVDGAIISWEVKMIKPNHDIYQCMLDRFGLAADECLFFDDNADNIAAAKEVGIKAELFTSYEKAQKDLEAYK